MLLFFTRLLKCKSPTYSATLRPESRVFSHHYLCSRVCDDILLSSHSPSHISLGPSGCWPTISLCLRGLPLLWWRRRWWPSGSLQEWCLAGVVPPNSVHHGSPDRKLSQAQTHERETHVQTGTDKLKMFRHRTI